MVMVYITRISGILAPGTKKVLEGMVLKETTPVFEGASTHLSGVMCCSYEDH